LFHGALTKSLRDTVMSRAANDYDATRWLDEVFPRDSVVLADIRSVALMPRPFLSRDFLVFADLDNISERDKVLLMLKSHHVNTIVLSLPLEEKMITYLNINLRGCIAGPQEFKLDSRNPWNREEPGMRLTAYRVNLIGPFSPPVVKQH